MLSYTAEELERETGFDRRTIAYYIQEGLIPRVGRRGPRTRYPKLVRDRLLFIRRVREAEESGAVSPVSLTVMGELFAHLSPEAIARVADGEIPVAECLGSRTSTVRRASPARPGAIEMPRVSRRAIVAKRRGRAPSAPQTESPPELPESDDIFDLEPDADYSPDFSAIQDLMAASEAEPIVDARRTSPDDHDEGSELSQALSELQEAASQRQTTTPTSVDTWSRIEISPDIALSVRGISHEDAGLLEKVRRKLKQIMSGRDR